MLPSLRSDLVLVRDKNASEELLVLRVVRVLFYNQY